MRKTVTCPNGHKIRFAAVEVVDGEMVCPYCPAGAPRPSTSRSIGSIASTTSSQSPPPPTVKTSPRRRTGLRFPLLLAALAFAALAVAQISAYRTYKYGSLVVLQTGLREHQVEGVAYLLLALAAIIGAIAAG